MLLKTYRLEIFNSRCNPAALSLHCFAHLDQDVSKALPYLNGILEGFQYVMDPPSVTLKVSGKLITVYGRKIAINALKDEAEARRTVEWLKTEINNVWDNRHRILPWYKSAPQPKIIHILSLLPKTNCGECGAPTCTVFATQAAEGAKSSLQCPTLTPDCKIALDAYLSGFAVKEENIPW